MITDDRHQNISVLNTILLAITLGTLAWIGTTTHQTAVQVATMMPRQEVDLRLEELHKSDMLAAIEITELKVRVTYLETELAKDEERRVH